ncbi:MAG: galactose mutarotase, partial [Bacteroidales bacterium]|nr:galactose mutarotase [Bacteroidales bacterium]
TDYGCKLVSVNVPDASGVIDDVIVGYGTLNDLEHGAERFAGAVVGRYGNRIYPSDVTICGEEYSLTANERLGGRQGHIHGGRKGFDRFVWEGEEVRTEATDSAPARAGVRFHRLSPDGEEGYPGNLDAYVTYWWDDSCTLRIEYCATTDRPTIVNMLNHAYFNLKGRAGGYVMDHVLQVDADRYFRNNTSFVPDGPAESVARTPFDFRRPHRVDYAIDTPSEQIVTMRGFSVCWPLDCWKEGELNHAATLWEPRSGRGVEVWTTEPGLLTYTGRGFSERIVGKYGPIEKFGGMLLETLHYPNSPHDPSAPSSVLLPGDEYFSVTEFRFFNGPSGPLPEDRTMPVAG